MADWMPGPRTERLAMCQVWNQYMTADRRTAWGVPQAQYNELLALYDAAKALLQKAQNEAERTHVVDVEIRAAFKALEAKMRFFKAHYFLLPPLTEADIAALGLQVYDPHHTPIPAPTGTPVGSLSYPGGPHAMMVNLGPMVGTQELDPRSDYGYAIYMGIMPPGGATLEQAASKKHYLMAPPGDGEGLEYVRFTRRRKEKLVFEAEDAGMTVYICVRYENGKGEVGQWGPVSYMIIP